MSIRQYFSDWLDRQHHKRVERLIHHKRTYAILMLLSDRRESMRLEAIHALGCCNDDLAYQTLTDLLQDPLASVRKAAALALANMNRPDGILSIERQLHVEKDSPVINVMRTALFRMKKTL